MEGSRLERKERIRATLSRARCEEKFVFRSYTFVTCYPLPHKLDNSHGHTRHSAWYLVSGTEPRIAFTPSCITFRVLNFEDRREDEMVSRGRNIIHTTGNPRNICLVKEPEAFVIMMTIYFTLHEALYLTYFLILIFLIATLFVLSRTCTEKRIGQGRKRDKLRGRVRDSAEATGNT
ncbi:hypothetical protein KQX54_008876 [Cotesia glomerata]|uniref:Uncharacterized protein n=1 Tax=Cotesia glomerata TaxID=32391 RepID=A0AAV7J223_COTGL|nr:hypothetical protein KQX54_008876 [Cotesia glomerata]